MFDKPTKIEEQMCSIGRHHWSVARLAFLASKLEVMDIPLKHLNMADQYTKLNLREMVTHIKAVNDADLSHPIILDEDGEIMDGRHRVMKSILEGAESIKAVRFESNPPPCKIIEVE